MTDIVDLAAKVQAICPFCRSTEVSANAKKVVASSYWRCAVCGEVWNPERLRVPAARDRYPR